MHDKESAVVRQLSSVSFRVTSLHLAMSLVSAAMSPLLAINTCIRSASLMPGRLVSTSSARAERFGAPDGASGWKWDKGGVGMGGKDKGPATEIKDEVGKQKTYKVPEYFKYDEYSFYDIEKAMKQSRCPQPKSGLTEFW